MRCWLLRQPCCKENNGCETESARGFNFAPPNQSNVPTNEAYRELFWEDLGVQLREQDRGREGKKHSPETISGRQTNLDLQTWRETREMDSDSTDTNLKMLCGSGAVGS